MINQLLKEIEDLIGTDDFYYDMPEKMEKIEETGAGFEIVPLLFGMMERHPLEDFGMPGDMVDFIEKFHPAFEKPLVESLKRRPAMHTLFMLNRCINGDSHRDEYIALLREIAGREGIEEEIREEARGYAEFQEKRAGKKPEADSGAGLLGGLSQEQKGDFMQNIQQLMSDPKNLKNPSDTEGNAAMLAQIMGLFK